MDVPLTNTKMCNTGTRILACAALWKNVRYPAIVAFHIGEITYSKKLGFDLLRSIAMGQMV